MKYLWRDTYCLAKRGATKDYKEEWEASRYLVGGKMFAMEGGDKLGRPILSLKLEPNFGELLRGQHRDIVPGYYMNKVHWNSLYLEGDVPDEVVKHMIDESYKLVFSSLTIKEQKFIEAGS